MHIAMFDPQGLIRGQDPEIGIDADTGGQTRYVLDLCRALAKRPEIVSVDLFTRLIDDPAIGGGYNVHLEHVADKFNIIRIECGGLKYLDKASVAEHVDEFVAGTLRFMDAAKLSPTILHGHHYVGGWAAAQVAESLSIPWIHTGHAWLGPARDSRSIPQSIADERMSMERRCLRDANAVICNSRIERDIHLPFFAIRQDMRVIPPGVNLNETGMYSSQDMDRILKTIFRDPDLPLILAAGRPCSRRRLKFLADVFANSKSLRNRSCLLVLGRRSRGDPVDPLLEFSDWVGCCSVRGRAAVMADVPYGSLVPAMMRAAAERGGCYVSPIVTETFGMAVLEAAACGLPAIVSDQSGAREIVKQCGFGWEIDVTDGGKLEYAIAKLTDTRGCQVDYQQAWADNAASYYTWDRYCDRYLELIRDVIGKP